MIGPDLVFTCDSIIAVCGAAFPVTIDGKPVDMWSRLLVRRNQKVSVGMVTGAGCCCYIAVKGGLPSVYVIFEHWRSSRSANNACFSVRHGTAQSLRPPVSAWVDCR